MGEGVCSLHAELVVERIDDHEGRIRVLEEKTTQTFERMDNTCKKLDALTKVLYWVATAWTTALGGFFIWYIQQLR